MSQYPRESPPFQPEPLEALKARFYLAVAELQLEPAHPQILLPQYFFDFQDGYRLHVTRDKVEEMEAIIVAGGMYRFEPWPLPLLVARVVNNFAALTDNRYGNPECVNYEAGVIMLKYDII